MNSAASPNATLQGGYNYEAASSYGEPEPADYADSYPAESDGSIEERVATLLDDAN